jgi:signal transduction histidine kinase
VGVLNVNRINHPEPFKEHHRQVLGLFAEHVGAVIDRAELMERLGERNRELEANVERLHESHRMKDVFLSTASHELKTPLTAVIAYAELLADHEQRLDTQQRGQFIARLRSEAQRLMGLIEEILDLSRIESGKLNLRRRRLDVAGLAHEAIETSRSMAAKHHVRLNEEYGTGLPEIWADEVKVRQAIVNLLVNAIKFSPSDSDVWLRVVAEPDCVRVEVADTGPGIAPEDTAHIFQLFGQGVRETSDQRGGLGIGLHLVKRLTELHGGHVGVNSKVGAGSTFWMRLPLAGAESEELPGDERSAA